MSKISSAKYYHKKRKDFKKNQDLSFVFVKSIKIFLKKRKTKSDSMVANDIKISQKMKKQRLVEYRTNYYKIWKNKTALQIKTVY